MRITVRIKPVAVMTGNVAVFAGKEGMKDGNRIQIPLSTALTRKVDAVEEVATVVADEDALTDNFVMPVLPVVPAEAQEAPVGGRLKFYWEVWETFHIDPWVVKTLKEGYWIEFSAQPPLTTLPVPSPISKDPAKATATYDQVNVLLKKGVIVRVKDISSQGFYSRFFVTPKKEKGKWRSILDLSSLNVYIKDQHFKMETAQSIRDAMVKGEWATSIDLQDAYFHVPIHPRCQKYLRFEVDGEVFQFVALPMGAKPSGQVFTRIVSPVKSIAHKMGIHIHQYLDDWLVRANTRRESQKHTQFILWIARALGFLVNVDKSETIPTQDIAYLGCRFLLGDGIVLPTQARWVKIQKYLQPFLTSPHLPAQDWLETIGLLISTEKLVSLGLLHLRPLQIALQEQWRISTDNPQYAVYISSEVVDAIRWWLLENNVMKGVPLSGDTETRIQVFTDASSTGWGGHIELITVRGVWTTEEKKLHINILELLAIHKTLEALVDIVRNKAVLVCSDNSTTVAYIKKQGGLRSKSLFLYTQSLYQFLEMNNVNIKARHIPGKLNVIADQLSRKGQIIPTEWSINPRILAALWEFWEKPMIDLFATRDNKQMSIYVSPIPDQEAFGVDALSMSWTGLYAYLFPPTAILMKVVEKIRRDKCEAVLIAPFWPQQAWFVNILELLIDRPYRLPEIQTMLRQPRSSIYHNNPAVYQLHAWRLSPSVLKNEGFLQGLPGEWHSLSNCRVGKYISQSGTDSVVGVLRGKLIHSKQLFLK